MMSDKKFISKPNISINEIKRIQTEIKKKSKREDERFLYAEMCKNK